jgi:adenylate kinase
MEAGQLVSDDIVLGIIRERLSQPDTKNGFVLDGVPRNIPQAEALDHMLEKMNQPLQLVLLVEVEFEALVQRLTGRRSCELCGAVFNVYTSPSKLDERCDKCGGNLRHRSDDNEETITNRLKVYEAQTEPLIAYYRQQGKLRVVQGQGEIPDIFEAIESAIQDMLAEQKRLDPDSIPEPEFVSSSSQAEVTVEDLQAKVLSAVRKARGDQQKPPSRRPVPMKRPVKKVEEVLSAAPTSAAASRAAKNAVSDQKKSAKKATVPVVAPKQKAAASPVKKQVKAKAEAKAEAKVKAVAKPVKPAKSSKKPTKPVKSTKAMKKAKPPVKSAKKAAKPKATIKPKVKAKSKPIKKVEKAKKTVVKKKAVAKKPVNKKGVGKKKR